VILRSLARLAEILRSVDRSWALVGGLAVSVRGEVRFTRDVDLAVVVKDDPDAEALLRQLRSFRMVAVGIVEQRATGRLATARMRDPGGLAVDLLFATSGIEQEIVRAATPFQIDGVGEVPVATLEHLIALKVLSVSEQRPQDRLDLVGLLSQQPDLRIVREALLQITDAGCHREQDLQEKLGSLLKQLSVEA
jgi:hypothetical protein